MTPYYDESGITIYHGDCRDVLPTLDPVTACVTDPPYGLDFMGKDWDHKVPGVEFWRLVRDALLPGAACLTFGGTRTYHRLTCAIEDAGFEIRDCLMWLYGSGFPKSLDISKAIDKAAGAEREVLGVSSGPNHSRYEGERYTRSRETRFGVIQDQPAATAPATDSARDWSGWGTALKPAWEPILLAMSPLDGTFAENAIKHGVAGLNIDGTRIDSGHTDRWDKSVGQGKGHAATEGNEIYRGVGGIVTSRHSAGRWPANVVHDGSDEVVAMFPETGLSKGGGGTKSPVWTDSVPNEMKKDYGESTGFGDSGSAARFFYSPKACGADRGNKPEYDMPLFDEVDPEVRNTHPTVKPTSVLHWLLTLISTPAGGVVIDPFMGSGTMLIAARDLGCRAVGIEIEEQYCQIAVKRLAQRLLD